MPSINFYCYVLTVIKSQMKYSFKEWFWENLNKCRDTIDRKARYKSTTFPQSHL